jgi:hypothetical protein
MTQETFDRAKASMKEALKEHGVPKNRKLEDALLLIMESMAEDAYFNGQMNGIKGDVEKSYWSSARV